MFAQQHILTGRSALAIQAPVTPTDGLLLRDAKASFILAKISRGPVQRPGAAGAA